ncbi:GIY-YIG nuclease family protein [Tessaracoccus sp. Y1736]
MLGGRDHVAEAMRALAGQRWPVAEAVNHVTAVPGLYAIYGHEQVWGDLGLPYRAETPLYVGKSEDNLVSRELGTHFAVGTGRAQTGSSTVRRSFAALLRGELGLHGVPRNQKDPGHFDKYGLLPDADARLTAWMHAHLTVAVWPAPADLDRKLKNVEDEIIEAWEPPLNLRGNPHPSAELRAARKEMATEAAAWAAREGISGHT